MSATLDDVVAGLGRIDKRLEKIDGRLEATEEAAAEAKAMAGSAISAISEIRASLHTLESGQAALTQAVLSLVGEVRSVRDTEARIAKLEAAVFPRQQ